MSHAIVKPLLQTTLEELNSGAVYPFVPSVKIITPAKLLEILKDEGTQKIMGMFFRRRGISPGPDIGERLDGYPVPYERDVSYELLVMRGREREGIENSEDAHQAIIDAAIDHFESDAVRTRFMDVGYIPQPVSFPIIGKNDTLVKYSIHLAIGTVKFKYIQQPYVG